MEQDKSNESISIPIFSEWIKFNLKVGFFSFGGAGRLLLYQDYVVQKKNWLRESRFRELLTVAQTIPGPNLVNLVGFLTLELFGFTKSALTIFLLAVPGTALAVLVYSKLPLENFYFRALFQGFTLGGALIYLVFIFRYLLGLGDSVQSQPTSPIKKSNFRVILRGIISLLLTIAMLGGWSIPVVMAFGIPLALLCEFVFLKDGARSVS